MQFVTSYHVITADFILEHFQCILLCVRFLLLNTVGQKSKPDLALSMLYVGHKLCNENEAI